MNSDEQQDPADDNLQSNEVEIRLDASNCLNYASWQNSVPLIRSLELCNALPEPVENLCLEVRSSPGFLRPKKWVIDRIGARSDVTIRDREVELDSEYLNGLNEAERGIVTFTVTN